MPFTYYDEIPSTNPTTQEILASLTGTQKLAVLNGYVNDVPATELKHDEFISDFAILHLYRKIDEIRDRSRALMRGEILITPAVLDPETGEIITPAVYNTPPVDANDLLVRIQDDFSDDFSSAQVTAILTKMVEYSKHDGSGTWSYYASAVVA